MLWHAISNLKNVWGSQTKKISLCQIHGAGWMLGVRYSSPMLAVGHCRHQFQDLVLFRVGCFATRHIYNLSTFDK
jgi:hypothetical protein